MILNSQSRRLIRHLTGVQPDRICRIIKMTTISSKLFFQGICCQSRAVYSGTIDFTPKNKQVSTNPNSFLFIGPTAWKRRIQEKERQVEMTAKLINLSNHISDAESVFLKRKIEKYLTTKQRTQMVKRNHPTGQRILRDKIPSDNNHLSKQALYQAAKVTGQRHQDFSAMNYPIQQKF